MRLLLTLSPSQMYEDETSGGLFLLLLSSRRLLCRQVGLAGFILHSQVSHLSNCFSFLDDPVCFSQAIHPRFFLHCNFCSLSGLGQCVGWSLSAGRGGGRGTVSHPQVSKSIAGGWAHNKMGMRKGWGSGWGKAWGWGSGSEEGKKSGFKLARVPEVQRVGY